MATRKEAKAVAAAFGGRTVGNAAIVFLWQPVAPAAGVDVLHESVRLTRKAGFRPICQPVGQLLTCALTCPGKRALCGSVQTMDDVVPKLPF